MSNTILLTGATGFLGSQIARRLLADTDSSIIVLVRAKGAAEAKRRLARAWWELPELVAAIDGRVTVICGDVTQPQLRLDAPVYADLVRQVTHIIHSAADLRTQAPLDELRQTNVAGVEHVLALARAAHQDHGLMRLAHISTAYVAGGAVGAVAEEALTDAHGFSTAYEQSKYEGERLVRAVQGELPLSILRPGMVVGDSQMGAIKTFNTLYFPLRLYLAGKLPIVPAGRAQRVNLVPVDYVADAVVRLTLDPRAEGLTFHLTAPTDSLPTAGELVDAVRAWAREHLGLRLPRPVFLPLPVARGRYQSERPDRKHRGDLDALRSLLPYFSDRIDFQRDNVSRLLGPYTFDWQQFLPNLLDYATRYSFLHRSERTVHEQILFRLARQRQPVTYHDLVEGRDIVRMGQEVRQDMLRAAAALRALGIGPGDRVALVGLNSTRYLTLDVAIGLVGAVSVPLYYTSPPAEIDAILQASGARVLLVGAPKVMERLSEMQCSLPTISFSWQPVPGALAERIMPWDKFLALGEGCEAPLIAPVGPNDLATLRYTSGTTGMPKGVMFTHEQLRWMGECMPALLPWRARHARASWLSCLPLNHVVEGILATYAPYFIPAPVDVYFLEDLRALPTALPQVRPSVFFSVPRIYERVWESLQQSPLGRRYLSQPDGLAHRLLRPLLRRGLLRKAGFDRCVQLIVGSAPVSHDLLAAYRELGIEIHNAYGLTEAPLVTINRPGRNRLGTVGEPLPDTNICIADDGEVLISGPQVTSGYYGESAVSPVQEGWLHTGDLGQVTEDGYLSLSGRKKELIKTSYGKYVQPARVESLLRDIPGVAEAMVVGEQRPYCVAVLWVQADGFRPQAADVMGQHIVQANTRLSHPEQVKRWAILPATLSVEGGELTANLKLKRQVVAQRFQPVLDALYADAKPPKGVLHVGRAERNGML